MHSGIASAPSQALAWWAERKERHERLQAMKNSGWFNSWGWTPVAKPPAVARAASEPAVPLARPDPEDAGKAKMDRELEWAKVGGMMQALGEVREEPESGDSEQSPKSPGRRASAPATAQSEEERRAERERLQMYSVLDAI